MRKEAHPRALKEKKPMGLFSSFYDTSMDNLAAYLRVCVFVDQLLYKQNCFRIINCS